MGITEYQRLKKALKGKMRPDGETQEISTSDLFASIAGNNDATAAFPAIVEAIKKVAVSETASHLLPLTIRCPEDYGDPGTLIPYYHQFVKRIASLLPDGFRVEAISTVVNEDIEFQYSISWD